MVTIMQIRLISLIVLSLMAVTAFAQGTYRNQRIFVVPCPGPVSIDGDLRDWDLSGSILSFIAEATRSTMNAQTSMMYDQQALYLAARIADPSPMMNQWDPAVNPDYGWDADAYQLRLSLDPAMGYPLNIGFGQGDITSDKLVHMTLWYYTAGKQPVLHMRFGMDFHLAPEYPKGIVPATMFQGAYKKWDDGKGYTLEYRIPWTTLRTQPVQADALLAGALQVQWSNADGSKCSGGSSVDLMAHAGFTYQSTEAWGKLIFTGKGHLPPASSQEGVTPERNLPLSFTLDVPTASVVSAVLINARGDRLRHLIVAQPLPSGRQTIRWDGLDDAGHVVPPGTYTWKAVTHAPFSMKYLLSVGNSGTPAYHTEDGKGAWGGDWGNPQDICAAGENTLICWKESEGGSGIIMVDAHGRKQWGGRFGAQYLATDGEWLYAYLTSEKQLRAYAVADGKQLNFLRSGLWAEPNDGKNTVCTGMAYLDGILYVANAQANVITAYQARQGTIFRTYSVPNARNPARIVPGKLAVITDGVVKQLDLTTGELRPWITTHLDAPQMLTVAPDGTTFVSNQGRLMNVSVYNRAGVYLKSIGKAGGRALSSEELNSETDGQVSRSRRGAWQPQTMLCPRGLAIDARGRLWVAEDDPTPKRVSIWDTRTGKLLEEKFGASVVSIQTTIDPMDPTRVYNGGMEWKVDLKKGTWRPAAVMVDCRKDTPYATMSGVVFTANNGRQYMQVGGYGWGSKIRGPMLYIRRGDHFEPCAGIISPDATFSWRPHPTRAPWHQEFLLWSDMNGDGKVQQGETKPTKMWPRTMHSCVDAALNFYAAGTDGALYWQRIRPTSILKNGVPLYDDATMTQADYAQGYAYDIAVNPADGSVMMYGGAPIKTMDQTEIWPLTYWSVDGKMTWRYRKGCQWWDMYEFPIAKPDELWGCTRNLGITDGITAFSSYFGMVHLLTTDGVVLGTVMKDGRAGDISGPERINCEWFSGQLVKMKDGRWLLLGGDQDGRVQQVFGLDTIRRQEGTLVISEAESTAAAAAVAAWRQVKATVEPLVVVRTQGTPQWSDIRGVTAVVDDARKFTAKIAYDTTKIYLRYEITAPFALTNSMQEQQLLFKGGNAIDLQLATQPVADTLRAKPVPGDLRVLITQQQGKALAVVYRYRAAGFIGQPFRFTSPTGEETVDAIEVWDDVALTYEPTATGCIATVALPLARLGWKPIPGASVQLDLGYLFGNATGNVVSTRRYWHNHSFSSGVINDVPSEVRIEPNHWGMATVE